MKPTTIHRFILSASLMLAACLSLHADILRISANSATRLNDAEIEADYTTTHLFVDEIAGDIIPITIFFDPQTVAVEAVDVFTNLNRRDRAGNDANADGIHDGILPVNAHTIASGDDNHYFKAHPMSVGSDGYYLTLNAEKTGAYRLTARYRLNGDAPGSWRWYNNRVPWYVGRDHAIVVSPVNSRDIRLYEINTLNIEASGTQFSQRSTFEDLSDRPGALHAAPGRSNNWNLQYAKDLGINWLWFQPYHPYGWEGRHLSAQNINERAPGSNASTWLWNGGSPYEDASYPYALGSPYAVKNFWEIDPRMSAGFTGDPTDINDVSSQANRDNAMISFQNFVADADAEGIQIMPDAAFNHTAWDVELGEPGIATDGSNPNASWMAAQGASGWSKSDLIHDRELRVFSRAGDYRKRAFFYNSFFDNNIAPAPDRTDFGKWLDVCDVFFGRYAALVGIQDGSETNNYRNEGDWFDANEYEYGTNPNDPGSGGSFDAFTRATWRYFARYAPYWLEKTRPAGENRNSLPSDGDAAARYAWDARGIDGLRCDFGQGLPPQAWEYIINVARSHKWSFVFMAETLDGGEPPYRSNRHFDILNENILFAAKGASNKYDFSSMFESRRSSFGQGLVLLNTVSHDEDNYDNPWAALARFATFSTIDGAPMIFPGQELGISKFYGYDLMEKNFGKYIPHFKTYNSMMPLWNDTGFGNDQLYLVYAAINQARSGSPALRSSNRWFMEGNGFNSQLYGVAKYESAGISPAFQDVVLAFSNLDLSNNQGDTYVIPDALADRLGLKDGRLYNVKNIAAYENPNIGMTGRGNAWLWGSGITGSDLKNSGFFVNLHKVPTTDPDWAAEPYEAQYLKLHDVTPPPAPLPPAGANVYAYAIGDSVTFTWTPASDPDGGISGYRVQIGTTPDGSDLLNATTTETGATVAGLTFGSVVYARVLQINNAGIEGSYSTSSAAIEVLDPTGDRDGDGQNNAAEQAAGTNPLDRSSLFKTTATAVVGDEVSITISSIPGKIYQLESSTSLAPGSWAPVGDPVEATGASTVLIHPAGGGDSRRFYRVRVIR